MQSCNTDPPSTSVIFPALDWYSLLIRNLTDISEGIPRSVRHKYTVNVHPVVYYGNDQVA